MALVWELGMSGFKSRSNQLPAMGVAYPLGVSYVKGTEECCSIFGVQQNSSWLDN